MLAREIFSPFLQPSLQCGQFIRMCLIMRLERFSLKIMRLGLFLEDDDDDEVELYQGTSSDLWYPFGRDPVAAPLSQNLHSCEASDDGCLPPLKLSR